MIKYNVLSFFDETKDDYTFLKTFTLYYVRQEVKYFEYKEGAASSDNICITVINVSEFQPYCQSYF